MKSSISVIIPSFNRAHYLPETLDSVLAQGDCVKEVIVIDDGSTDNTAEVLQPYQPRVKVLTHPNAGLTFSVNRGLKQVTGEFILILDSDDLLLQGAFHDQLTAFKDHPDVGLVFGHMQEFISPEVDEAVKRRLVCHSEPRPGYIRGAMLARRSVYALIGNYDEALRLGDFPYWFGLAHDAGIKDMMLPRVVLHRRLHALNTGRREPESKVQYAVAMRKLLNERRKEQSG